MSLLAQLDLPARSKRPARSKQPELSDQMFGQLRSFIYDKTGIYFQDNKRYLLASRVGRRLGALKLPGFGAYYNELHKSSMNGELKDLVNAVTINETFFFRNVPKFDILEKELIPEIIERRAKEGKRQIRIWSAACSTGDEPYTIALMVKDRLQPKYPHVRFEIVGTDINTDVLEKARVGIYGEYAVRNVPPPVMRKHFTEDGAHYRLNPEVCRMVGFHHVNLSDRAAMIRMRGVDIVLCANVLIYFDNQAKQRVVSSIYNDLNAGGYLLVGFSETLYGVSQSFQSVRFGKTIAYKKG